MSADARANILEACQRVIAQSGLPGFRMSHVAREAKVSIGLLSYHFGDRAGLLAAALNHVNFSTELRANQSIAQADADSPLAPTGQDAAKEQLCALLCSEFSEDPAVRVGSTAWNEFRAFAVHDEEHAVMLCRSTAEWQTNVERLIVAASGSDEPATRSESENLALVLTALVEGLSGRWLTGQITAETAQRIVRAEIHRML